MKKEKDESGFLILEATFAVTICMIVMFLLLSVAFWLYQQVMVTVVTNEIAGEIAQNYKLVNIQDDKEITLEDIDKIGWYRYTIQKNNFKIINENTANTYAAKRIGQTSLSQSNRAPKVTIEPEIDDLGRRHYVVTVRQEYTFLLGNILNLIGLDGTQTIERTAYVQGTDILSYVNTVKTSQYLMDMVGKGSGIVGATNSIIAAANEIIQLVRDLVN